MGLAKTSSKGVNKRQNQLVWDQYYRALNLEEDEEVTNVGIRKGADGMITYAQKKNRLSGYYDKRFVWPDLIHTSPIDWTHPRGCVQVRTHLGGSRVCSGMT